MGEFKAGQHLVIIIVYFLILGMLFYFGNLISIWLGGTGLGVSDLDAMNFSSVNDFDECHTPITIYMPSGAVLTDKDFIPDCENMIASVQNDSCILIEGCSWETETSWFGLGTTYEVCVGNINYTYYNNGSSDYPRYISDYPLINNNRDTCILLGGLWYNENDFDQELLNIDNAQTFGELLVNLITLRFNTDIPDDIEKPINVIFIHCVIIYAFVCIYLLLPFAH